MGTLAKVQWSREERAAKRGPRTSRHLTCPFCNSYDVGRLFLASLNLDSCECATCGARWDEERGSGEYRGRAQPSSVLMARHD